MATIKIPQEEMLRVLSSTNVILDSICGHGRWSVQHELIFRRDGKLYRTTYSVGATESQDETPWDYLSEVECTEVRPREVTVTEYVPVE
jgi:hypothetical protein